MTPAYVAKLGLKSCSTNVGAHKIDGSIFQTFVIVLASFLVNDKLKWVWFFQETFLLADISLKAMLRMLFLTFINADIQFIEKELT